MRPDEDHELEQQLRDVCEAYEAEMGRASRGEQAAAALRERGDAAFAAGAEAEALLWYRSALMYAP